MFVSCLPHFWSSMMTTHARICLPLLALLLIGAMAVPARAGNLDEITNMTRHTCTSCRYGDPRRCSGNEPHHPCRHCQMSWQPIRSMLHPNMLPAGMIRPKPPLNRMIQNLIPKMPARWLDPNHPWSGCRGGHCQ